MEFIWTPTLGLQIKLLIFCKNAVHYCDVTSFVWKLCGSTEIKIEEELQG